MKKILASCIFFFTFNCFATINIFNADEGNWNVPGNWSGDAVPTVSNQPIIPAGKTAIINCNVGQCGAIYCGQSTENPRWGRVKMYAGGELTSTVLILGRDFDNHGIFWVSGGKLTLSGYLSIGDNGDNPNSAYGSLFLSGGYLKMLGNAEANIGNRGYGEMTVSGNGIFYANDITVGSKAGSEGSKLIMSDGKIFANNIDSGSSTTSDGDFIITGGSLTWSNLFHVRDVLSVKNGAAEINGVINGGTALYLDEQSTLEFELGANGIAPILINNSEIYITSGASLLINGTDYTRAGGYAKSFLLVKHNGYANQVNFTPANIHYTGFGALTPSIRYESNGIYLDLTASDSDYRQMGKGLFMKYWELPINNDGHNNGNEIVAPIDAVPLFTSTLVRTHSVLGQRVEKIDLTEALKSEDFFAQFEGYIDIPTNGSYTFYLKSDDGSKLWLDGTLLIDNDGHHPVTEKSAVKTLTKGMHKFEVGYFQGTADKVLTVSWAGPGFAKEEIPENVFYVAEEKDAFENFHAFQNIYADRDLYYNYCPSFMYDETEGLYKIWSGGSVSGGDYIYYKESPTIKGLLTADEKYVFAPSGDPSKFDQIHTCDPNVFSVNGVFYLSYSGNTDGSVLAATTRIGMAVSYDRGRSWSRLNNGNHILAPSDPDGGTYGVGQSAVVQANDGYFYMLYTDADAARGGTYIDVIRSTDPAFPTDKHELITDHLRDTGGASLDLAYDSQREEFIVIADRSDRYNETDDPYAKVGLVYYDKNWNLLRSEIIQVHPLWSFGEGAALLSDLRKKPVNYSYNGDPSYIFTAATREYEENTTLWANWVEGGTKLIITSLASPFNIFEPEILSQGLLFNSNRTDVIMTGLHVPIKNNFTVDFWAKPYTETTLLTEQTDTTAGLGIDSLAVRPDHGDNTAYLPNSAGVGFAVGMNGFSVCEYGGGYAPPLLTWQNNILDWTHFTVVYSNQTPYLYVNGNFARQGLHSAKDNSYITINYFGGDTWGDYGYGGYLWNYRVWTRQLTDTEIKSLPGTFAEENLPSDFYGSWLKDPPVEEGSALGTKVLNAKISGGISQENFHFYLADNVDDRFAIDPTSGELSVLKGNLIDYEKNTSYTVTVCCANSDYTTEFSRKFVVNVDDISMNPRFDVALNCIYFNGSSYKYFNSVTSNIFNNFTISFYAKPERSILLPSESTSGAIGLDANAGFVVVPTHGSIWGDSTVHVGAGVAVGTNGIAVYEHGSGYLPALLVWKSDTELKNWMHISVVYSNQTPRLYVNGIKVKTGLTSSKTVHPSESYFGGQSGLSYYKGYFSEYRIQSDETSQTEIRNNIDTWAINDIPYYYKSYLPELIVTNGCENGSKIGKLIPYVDKLSDSYSFSLIDDAYGRFDIGSMDGTITVKDITKFNNASENEHQITARMTSDGLYYQKNITIHVDENVIPEPCSLLFIICQLLLINYWRNKD